MRSLGRGHDDVVAFPLQHNFNRCMCTFLLRQGLSAFMSSFEAQMGPAGRLTVLEQREAGRQHCWKIGLWP